MSDCYNLKTISHSEVNEINKQKFLAELARLLTFMYEEDRQQALAAYTEMFDEAEDEQALIQALISPIRQAVVVARAYNAAERKLQVHTQSREDVAPQAEEGTPEYMRVIAQIRVDALGAQAARRVVDENQFSLFDEAAEAAAEQPAFVEAPLPVEAADEPEEEAPAVDEPQEESLFADEPAADEPASDPVDAFLADFSIAEEAAEETPEAGEKTDAVAEPEEEAEVTETTEEPAAAAVVEPQEVSAPAPVKVKTVRKPRVFLLILYILIAIPVTLVGIALLLIPTLLSLSVASALISVGILTLTSAFGGFAIFADLLIVLGAALVLLALGLLFLWLFVWFLGGAIAGLVRGVVHLGGKWCYKEVPAV